MVGLCVAHQLLEKNTSTKIVILDKAKTLGQHSSGRNSGVLHAGLYYKPNSLKAKVCVSGAKRLKTWIKNRNLPLNECGKIIVPQRENLDAQIDVLYERGCSNGAKVEILDKEQLKTIIPEARSASGRALWSANTAVTKPLDVVQALAKELQNKGVTLITNESALYIEPNKGVIKTEKDTKISFKYLFNCAGLNADKVAHMFGIGKEYILLPFKGIYWELKDKSPIKVPCNLYPVPDLSVPFLGVHFTPSADNKAIVRIGPTATPAWGRENYDGLKGIEPRMAARNLSLLAQLYLSNRGRFRNYVHDQAFLSLPPLLLKAAQELIPSIRASNIKVSKKVGIRSQLVNLNTLMLEDDFLCIKGPRSTHVLNAISPAFTASFELADLIISNSNLSK